MPGMSAGSDYYLGAFLRKKLGSGAADAGTGAGDDSDFTGKTFVGAVIGIRHDGILCVVFVNQDDECSMHAQLHTK